MRIASAILKAERVGIRNLSENLSKLLNEGKPYVITDHGKPKQVLLPYDEMMELIDILDELSDPETLSLIKEGRKDIASGKAGIPLSALWDEMGT
ncbi:MAG: type II toxin-antitoxin system Phd/YefM family antitoxin [Gemmatimonadota bacterium]|nr:MAG: type II toxin-antitoxin system Phd/YefM family antitoxin [Gemmatimonadota bacterium]